MPETPVPSRSVSQRAAIGAGWIIAWRMTSRNLGLVSTLILVHLLQPSDFGLVSLAAGLITSVDALSAIGVHDALVRSPEVDRDLYDTGFTLNALRCLLTALVIALIAWPVGSFFGDSRLAVVMLALAVGSVLAGATNIGIVDFRRDIAFEREFALNVAVRIVGVLTTIAAAVAWRSYWALVIGLLVMRVVHVPLSYKMSSYRPRLCLRAWRRIIGFSLWSWAQTIVGQVRDRSDSIVITRALGTQPFGVFSVGLELGTLPVTELIEPLGKALFSGFASLHNAAEGLGNMFRGAVGLSFLIALPAGLGISMIADPAVRLMLGERWIETVPIVQIIAIGAISTVFVHPCGAMLNAIGRPHTVFYLTMASTSAKLIALLALVPAFGLRGAAWGLVVTWALDMALFIASILGRAGITLRQLAACTFRPAVAAAAMVAVLWQMNLAWTASTAQTIFGVGLDVLLRSAIGSATYMVSLGVLWYIVGRPDGAERFLVSALYQGWQRVDALCKRWMPIYRLTGSNGL